MRTYRVKDLSIASLLYLSGKKLVRLDDDNGRIWFVFDDESSCRALADSFWRKESTVDAKEFSDAIRSLKTMIFNRKNG